MKKVIKHIEQIFEQIPKNKQAGIYKKELLNRIAMRYLELSAQDIDDEKIEDMLFSEVGSSEEIVKAIKTYCFKRLFLPAILYVVLFITSILLIVYTQLSAYLSISFVHLYVALIFFFGTLIVMNMINIILKNELPIIYSFRLRMFTFCVSIIFLLIIYFFPHAFIINNFMGISVIAGELFFFGTRNSFKNV
ncbi:hypothetical protein Sgly_1240 [Syntrophobotulus glycolicus DSM 8271]|uniref:Uncharacterized protein n=1 Tax=Syntrophobotulus glycolicus (strain DSM 8271 / FlGlyR) TaxID=645991 RepID=F0SV56_SYNGF|nr:hypothetical protein [Syntrophobotulus glycolicus]ADY55556.1 hypothetical protein Sgly_1240 [Syntrophobotulus glycolicus DSM 8271]